MKNLKLVEKLIHKIKTILPKKILPMFREINTIINQPWYKDNLITKHTYQFLVFKKILMKLRRFIYKGKNVFCPTCEKYFRKFLYSSERCPYCGSFRRHRLLMFFLKIHPNFFTDNLKVLHISPNKFLQIIFKNKSNLDYVSVGLNPSAMIKMDITNLSYEDDSFNTILCYHVLEHIKNDILALQELYRVLKPKGWAIIQSPIDLKSDKTFEYPDTYFKGKYRELSKGDLHVRTYGIDYKERLKEAGFKVIVENLVGKLSNVEIKKFGLDKNEMLYFCIK